MKNLIFNRETGNIGGINRVRFILPEEIYYIDDIINNEINTILVDNEEHIREIDIIQESGFYNEKELKNDIHETEIEFNVAKEELDKIKTLTKLSNNKILLIITSNNSTNRIVGLQDNFCRIISSFNSGQKVADINAYKLKVNHKSKFPNPFFTDYLGVMFECLNFTTSQAFMNFPFVVSIEIRNNSINNINDVEQIFEFENLDSVSVIHNIAAKTTVKFETTILIPTLATNNALLQLRGVCNSTKSINVLNPFTASKIGHSPATPLSSLTISIEITNNRNFEAINVEQNFEIEGIGFETITHNINALSTVTFETIIELPSIIEDFILLRLTGASNQQILIPVKTGNLLYDADTILILDNNNTQLISE